MFQVSQGKIKFVTIIPFKINNLISLLLSLMKKREKDFSSTLNLFYFLCISCFYPSGHFLFASVSIQFEILLLSLYISYYFSLMTFQICVKWTRKMVLRHFNINENTFELWKYFICNSMLMKEFHRKIRNIRKFNN